MKTWLPVLLLNLVLIGVIAKLRSVMEKQIPVGYQDGDGFHYGVKH